jgi:hypothetical protein
VTAPLEPPAQATVDVVDRWHRFMRGELPDGLDALLDDDVIFYSPVVFTPQAGREMVTLYITAAALTFPGDEAATSTGHAFRYTKQVIAGDTAVLEFETTMAGKHVNGVDIIRVNEHARIVEFRVMVRPLQALNTVHQLMGAALQTLGSPEISTAGSAIATDR